MFKGGDFLGDADEIWVQSPDAGGLCGVTGLELDDVYLLSGK